MRTYSVWCFFAPRWAAGRRLLLAGCLPLLAGACQPSAKDPASSGGLTATPAGRLQKLEAALTDSLFKYRHLQEFTQRDDSARYALYGTQTTFGKVGVVAVTDSVLLVFQEVKHRFQLTNHILFDNYATGFKEIDLNGDNQDDFIVYGHPNIHGQAPPFVFMNDGKGVLHYYRTPLLNMYAIDYDPVRKLVRTEYVGGAFDTHSKELYQWQGDSLRQVAGAELHLEHPDTVTVRVYKVKNGKEYGVKTYSGEAAYDTVLFKSNEF